MKDNVVIGIPSSGIHSNGYSLVRKLFFDKLKMKVSDRVEELNMTLGEALITPTKIYTKHCNSVLAKKQINGIVHITGGGFFENIPRIIPEGLGVKIKLGSWEAAPIFDYIQKKGDIETEEMFATFNMGIGMMMVVDPADVEDVINLIKATGENAFEIGRIVEGKGVTLC